MRTDLGARPAGTERVGPSQRTIRATGLCLLLSLGMLGLAGLRSSPGQAQGSDVEVVFTADNAYGFGYGDIAEMKSYFGGIENRDAREIFSCNPEYGVEEYVVPGASVDDFLYIVAWSDKSITQGVLGQFSAGGKTVYTGIGQWEVYATGSNYGVPSAGPGPDLDEINGHIQEANALAGDPGASSRGWVGLDGDPDPDGALGELSFGEANDDAQGRGNFPAMVCLEPEARWMWYNSDPASINDPFRGGPLPGGHKEYLIFRAPVREVLLTPTPGPTATPAPLFLPLLLRERCPPKDFFADIALVLDSSTTMRGQSRSGRPKIEAAVEALQTFLGGLRLQPGADRVALLSFDSASRRLAPLVSDRAQLDAAIASIVIGEGSRIDLGIQAGTMELARSPRSVGLPALVLLSDGLVNGATKQDVLDAAAEARELGAKLYVVGLGVDRDEGLLRALAGDDGLFVPAEDADLLAGIYADLAQRVPCPAELYWGRR